MLEYFAPAFFSISMKILSLLIGFLLSGFDADDERRLVSWLIIPASSLSIEGASNLNSFSCGMDSYQRTDTLVVIENTPTHLKFSPNKLAIPVAGFDCENNLITRDFRETLFADTHPEIGISFLSFKKILPGATGKSSYDAHVAIELAGRTREVNIRFDFYEKSYSLYHLSGSKILRFSDFGFTPPQKAMGLIKVEDELTINFNLMIRPL